jgi:alpha-tubulin suppressor-like RCC1 family protein
LGIGTTTTKEGPSGPLQGVLSTRQVIDLPVTCEQHCLAITNDNNIAGWGHNSYGMSYDFDINNIGTTTTPRNTPILTSKAAIGNAVITSIALGAQYSYCVASEKLYSWGWSDFGLGDGPGSGAAKPYASPVYSGGAIAGKRMKKVYANSYFVIALDTNEAMYSWGRLISATTSITYGLGSMTNSVSNYARYPTLIPSFYSGKTVAEISITYYSAYALMTDGTLYGLGDSYYTSTLLVMAFMEHSNS